jgi:acylphosphatase
VGSLPKELHAYFFGEVQGVGFRYTTQRLAAEKGLTGYVKNCSNGSVEALFQGKTDDINDMVDDLNNAFNVTDTTFDWRPETTLLRDFSIRHY